MLKKEHKIERGVFKALNKPFKSINSNIFVLKMFQNPTLKTPKFSVSISKKYEKKAVLRNKIRRVAYKVIRDNLGLVKNPFYYHFILKQKPKTIKDDINRDILSLMSQI